MVDTGDFDGDGRTDILFVSDEGNLQILSQAVSARFHPVPLSFALQSDGASYTDEVNLFRSAEGRAVADLNHDGRADLIAIGRAATATWINEGSGTVFSSNVTTSAITGTAIEAADVDGDGDADLIVLDTAAKQVHWLEQPAEVAPVSTWSKHFITTMYSHDQISLADVDDDGDLDLVSWLGGDRDTEVHVWHENRTSDAQPWPTHRLKTGELGDLEVIIADVNRDSIADVLFVEGAGEGRELETTVFFGPLSNAHPIDPIELEIEISRLEDQWQSIAVQFPLPFDRRVVLEGSADGESWVESMFNVTEAGMGWVRVNGELNTHKQRYYRLRSLE